MDHFVPSPLDRSWRGVFSAHFFLLPSISIHSTLNVRSLFLLFGYTIFF